MAGVALRGVTKRYGSTTAVAGVDLEVADGELLALLGASGSGKSTLLRLLAGIETLDAGEIWVGSTRVDPLLPGLRDIAMVFQSYALYPHMTVAANLAFPLRCAGVGRAEAARRVAQTAALLELDHLLERRPGQLSGGQQQRVALGRAIVRRPKVFLMDEPLSNLDAQLRARTRLELSRLHERLGVTTIYVTHDQVEAMTMGQRIAVIDSGRLHQVATPETVYDHPADLVVAAFLGSPPMNTLPGRCQRAGADLRVRAPGVELAVPLAGLDPAVRAAVPERETELVVGLRPERLGVAGGAAVALGQPGGQAGFAAVVERVELLGNERIVYLRAGGWAPAMRVPAEVRPDPGERLWVSVAAAGVRLFDPATGLLLGG